MRKIGVFALAALIASCSVAAAQDNYPSQTVKIVLPNAPGSTTDILTRLLADHLARKWGKTTVVENIAGGMMNVGAAAVARAAPDGYTLMVAPPAPFTINHLISKDLSYSPSSFVPITLLAKISNVLAVRKTLPAQSVKDLIAYGKANPGKLTFATQGPGSTAHLTGMLLQGLTGIQMVAVPYRGAQQALNGLVAGDVDMFFDTVATSTPLHRADKLKILAVAGLERAKALPELPTVAEAGVPGFRSITWFAFAGPSGLPPALVEQLNRDAVEVLRSKEFSERLETLSLEVGATTPAETARFFSDEAALWSGVIKQAGITSQ
jgi:tripartite-type tricarboxylate transporter receptor subunit TctC